MGLEELVGTGGSTLRELVDALASAREEARRLARQQARETRSLQIQADVAERRVQELRDEIRYLLGLE